MRVTVAIPTYNRADLLCQMLEGVTRQNFPAGDFEILVIDNNSTDDTAGVVASFAARTPSPRRVVESSPGLNHARNRAVAEAAGAIVLFGDDDILVPPDWVQQMAAPFARPEAEKIGAVGGEVVPVFPHGLPPWVAEWHSPLGFRRDPGPIEGRQEPMGANLAFPRSIFARLGPFQTNLDRKGTGYLSGGDTEMIRRIRREGWVIWFVPGAAVRHQLPASRTTFRYAARHAFDSARSRIIYRGHDTGLSPYLGSRLFANLAKAIAFALLALGNALILRTGAAKKALVRAWRACGYIYQIMRTTRGLDKV